MFILFVVVVFFAGLSNAAAAPDGSPFGDLKIESGERSTEIALALPASVAEEDLTKTRPGLSAAGMPAHVGVQPTAGAGEAPQAEAPGEEEPLPGAPGEGEEKPVHKRPIKTSPGALTVNEIHLFFPGATLERPRVITVGDRIIQETRLFPDEGGVSMTVVVRRPVYYVVWRDRSELHIHVEPGTLLLKEPAGRPLTTAEIQPGRVGGRAPRRRGARAPGGVQGGTGELVPQITMPSLGKGEGLTVDAEHLSADEEKNEIVARGHVTIARASSLLTADEVRINRDTKEAQAKGNVEFTDPQGTVQAESFQGNLEDETGELTNGTVYLNANHLTITGTKLEKSFGQTYHIENGQFTTCQCGAGAPSWSIAGKSMDVTLNGLGLVEDAKFKVLDVPVFYLPYLAFSAKKTRQSGLLAPLFGYSNKDGFSYMQPIYWAVNKSLDFTIAPAIQTSSRVGAVSEMRYALTERSKGVLDFAYYNEFLRNNANGDVVNTSIADPTIPENRWSLTASVEQELPYGLRAFADSLAVSDSLYLREIPDYSFDPLHQRTLTTSRFSSSTGGVYKSWENATLTLDGTYYQDFFQEQDLTLQRLPETQLIASDRFFNRNLKLAFNGQFVNFARTKGFDGPRVDLPVNATVPFRWQEFLNGNLGLQLRETAYHLNNTDYLVPVSSAGGVQNQTGVTLAKNPTREILQASAVLGSQLSRVFDVGGEDVEKLKHTIEPEVDYLFVPQINQDDLPTYDFIDRINGRNLFTYGFTTRLLAKLSSPPPLEVRGPFDVGYLNPFTDTPAPFRDEATRGGLSALGNPEEETPSPYGVPATSAEVPTGVKASGVGEEESLTPEQKAERRKEEESAVSHVVEWARLQIFQSADLRNTLQTSGRDHFSDVDAHIRLYPVNYFNLFYDSTVYAKQPRLTSASVGVTLRDPRRRRIGGFLTTTQRASTSLSYRFIADGVLKEVDNSVMLPVADTLSLFFLSSYDALQKQFLTKIAGFRLTSQCQCWVGDFEIADRTNPNETQLRFQVTLIGLGSIGRAR